MITFKQFLEQKESPPITVELTGEYTEDGDIKDYMPDVNYETYDVFYNGEAIGEVHVDDYFGYISGTLGGRGVKIDRNGRNVQLALNQYFSEPAGQKRLEALTRQLGIT